MDTYTIRPIAYVRSDYNEKFGIPKQAGLVDELEQAIVFTPDFANADALRGIEGFTRIWIIWGFSENAVDMTENPVKWSPTVRPPRLGGKIRKGVWATRSPYRPNSLGLSNVRLKRIMLGGRPLDDEESEGINGELALIVSGADMMDGTPVFDIKPYMPYADSHPEESSGFSNGAVDELLEVEFPEDLLTLIDESKSRGLIKVLSLDPRPAYDKKDGNTYGLSFADWDIKFTVSGGVLTVTGIEKAGCNDRELCKEMRDRGRRTYR